jgi:hypothetical protein
MARTVTDRSGHQRTHLPCGALADTRAVLLLVLAMVASLGCGLCDDSGSGAGGTHFAPPAAAAGW